MDDELKECPWCGQTTHYYLQKDGRIICDSCKKEVEARHILHGNAIQKGINDEARSDNSRAAWDWEDDNPPKDS